MRDITRQSANFYMYLYMFMLCCIGVGALGLYRKVNSHTSTTNSSYPISKTNDI